MYGKNVLINLTEAEPYQYAFPAKGANSTLATLLDLQATRTPIADADYVILSTDRIVALTSITAARVFTLPNANSVPAGTQIMVIDDSGSLSSTNTLTVQKTSTNTINGGISEVMSSPYARRIFVSDGSSKWDFDGGIMRLGNVQTITGAKTFADYITINKPIISNAGVPTLTLGAGAGVGNGASYSLTSGSNDIAGQITLTTGNPVTGSGTIFTFSFSTTYSSAPKAVMIYQNNSTMANQFIRFYASSYSTTGWVMQNTSTALGTATTFIFSYLVIL